MNSARIIVSTVFALAIVAAAAWAGPTPEKPATASMHVAARSTHAKTSAKVATPRVDLNTATRDELMKLPGVDGAIADKILAARPLKSRGELRSKGLVSAAEYAKLRDHVAAKPVLASNTK